MLPFLLQSNTAGGAIFDAALGRYYNMGIVSSRTMVDLRAKENHRR
jgi:hypothetical protein